MTPRFQSSEFGNRFETQEPASDNSPTILQFCQNRLCVKKILSYVSCVFLVLEQTDELWSEKVHLKWNSSNLWVSNLKQSLA